jgi:glycosyltransferase involved in cell wall biosynthesis
MRVWLLHIGEELPVDGTTRLLRYGYLAKALTCRGHEVLRWAPTFRHATKSFRFTADTRVPISHDYSIQFVHSLGYRRNASLERLLTYRILGNRFRQLAKVDPAPDVIVAAIPSLEWATAAIDYGRARGIPVVIDVRDLWPDVFLNALPKSARSMGRVLLHGYERMARRACSQANALTAVSQSYLGWALKKAGRSKRPSDCVMPIGFEPELVDAFTMERNRRALTERGIDSTRPVCLFSGLFERSYDLEAVIDAARKIQRTGASPVQFVLCGDGGKMAALKERARGLPDVHFLGWVDGAMLQTALSISSIGLCPYADDALQSLPNKPFEYMAGRLAILSSLPGDLARLLDRHQCGITYPAGDSGGLAKCLESLLVDPKKLATLRARAYEAWSQYYHSAEIYARFVDQLESVRQPAALAA